MRLSACLLLTLRLATETENSLDPMADAQPVQRRLVALTSFRHAPSVGASREWASSSTHDRRRASRPHY
jgi:hypothetical protein